VNYTEDKLERVFLASLAARKGTELHELAHRLIKLGVRLPDTKKTLHMYVNDAIGYRMTPEQILFYSDNCYGTADTISFSERNMFLRIHDFKSGSTRTTERQLQIYAALFCLEYGYKPFDITSELRIYQSNEVRVYPHDPDAIAHIMSRIVVFDRILDVLKVEAQG